MGLNEAQDLDLHRIEGVLTYINQNILSSKSLGIRGNRHVRYPKGTPLANLMLGMTDRYGVHLDKFGDSNAAIDLTTI